MLKVKHLHKYYHNFGHKPLHVINDTSIEIPETGIIAVVGASGAGKTSLINTISGLDSFKSGSISFDDVEMKHYNTHLADKMRMKNYGFIFQNYYLLEKQTVYENVKVSLDAFDISESEKKKRVNYVLNQLGIAKYTNKVVTSLSGGEQQRVSIARALVKSPKVIFADEPTGSLDEITTFNVLNIFKQISKTCAVFIVTHERDIISYYADYIIEIENGVVVKEFSPSLDNEKTLSIDQNIYLDELNHVEHQQIENLSVDFYSDNTSKDVADIKIAVRNGKIYLESSKNITILDSKSENHMVKGERKKIKDYVKNNFDFELEPLSYNHNKFGFKEVVKKAYQNFKMKRKSKTILKAMCLALSVLTLGLVEGFNTLETIDISKDLQNSEGNIYLNITADNMNMRTIQIFEAMNETCATILRSDLPGELLFEPSDRFLFKYEGFSQIKNQSFALPSNDFKDIKYFDESTLTYGAMPQNGYEVVVDEYVLSKLVKGSILEEIAADYSYFIGKKLASNVYNYSVTIAGVCRTRNPVIYGYEGLVFARLETTYRVRVIDIDYAKQIYPEFKDITLEPGHCLKNEASTSATLSYLEIDGTFKDLPYDNIVSKREFDAMKYRFSGSRKMMYIQTDGSQTVIDSYSALFTKVVDKLKENDIFVKIEILHPYAEQKAVALENLNNIMNSVRIVAYVVLALALILVILSTYLSMLNQISDIAVYRSLGYSRSFLGMIYLFELGFLALIYSLIGGLVTYLAMLIVDVMPLISYTIATPFWAVLLSILAIPLAIMIIGMIPIMLVFRLTPASIYSRYNRKINNE